MVKIHFCFVFKFVTKTRDITSISPGGVSQNSVKKWIKNYSFSFWLLSRTRNGYYNIVTYHIIVTYTIAFYFKFQKFLMSWQIVSYYIKKKNSIFQVPIFLCVPLKFDARIIPIIIIYMCKWTCFVCVCMHALESS